ncbi:hypothetical protein [Haloglycomyces albus]|uniref:hypothetical protein n=1 Tax=Haloglycomyces albus TaxID=526067 RepID=UPI00046CE943|nr:hypothetical protein [Haloglycomyces albus]
MKNSRISAFLLASALLVGVGACSDSSDDDSELPEKEDDRPLGPDPDFPDSDLEIRSHFAEDDPESVRATLTDDLDDAYEVESDSDLGILSVTPTDVDTAELHPTLNLILPFRIGVWEDEAGSRISYLGPNSQVDIFEQNMGESAEDVAAAWDPIEESITDLSDGDPDISTPAAVTFTQVDSEHSASDLLQTLDDQAESQDVTVEHLESAESQNLIALGVEGETDSSSLIEEFPEAALVVPTHAIVTETSSGGSTVRYFDPFPLLSAIDSDLRDAGMEISSQVSDFLWDAALAE